MIKQFINFGPSFASYVADHQENYPVEMRERNLLDWRDRLKQYRNLNVAAVVGGKPVAWSIMTDEDPKSAYCVYWYDLSCLVEFQGQGYAKAVLAETYRRCHAIRKWIRMHCRKSTYPRNPAALEKAGWVIVNDVLIPHHYQEEYGIDEDAHELLLRPV